MLKKEKTWFFFVFVFISLFSTLKSALAVCPVCTVAVASGLGVSRWLGIDDFISSLWIGGLNLSIIFWTLSYLKRKDKLTPLNGIFVFFLFYATTIYSLHLYGALWIKLNTLWGVDKIILGVLSGTLVFWVGAILNSFLKKKNGGKVYFSFQKVIIPSFLLLVASLIYYFACKCLNLN
jgi:hypothetical protein